MLLLSPFCTGYDETKDFPGGSAVKNPPANAGDTGLIPESGGSPGKGCGNPLQYSCLGSPMDRGAWWATVHGVTKESDTAWQLNNGETKVQRDQITCQGHAANEQQRLDMTELLTQFTAEETSNVKKLGSNLIRLILCS